MSWLRYIENIHVPIPKEKKADLFCQSADGWVVDVTQQMLDTNLKYFFRESKNVTATYSGQAANCSMDTTNFLCFVRANF